MILRIEDLPEPDFPISSTLRLRDCDEVEPDFVGCRTDIFSENVLSPPNFWSWVDRVFRLVPRSCRRQRYGGNEVLVISGGLPRPARAQHLLHSC